MNIIEEAEKIVQDRLKFNEVLNRLDVYQGSLLKVLPQVLSWKGEMTTEFKDTCDQLHKFCDETKKLIDEVQVLIPNSTAI